MSKALVIVESPAKIKTISKYLGSDYTVEASIGHIRDLPLGKTDIKVSKAWVNAGSNAWPENIKSVQIGLYYSVNNGEPVALSGKKCTLDADHTSYTFEDLLTTDDDNNPITYIVREESVTLADNTVVSPEEAGINVSVSDISNGAVVVTNTIKPDLPLLKVDKNNHAVKLSGAEFSIEKKNVDFKGKL